MMRRVLIPILLILSVTLTAYSFRPRLAAAAGTNIAPSGTGYRWHGLTSLTSNSNKAASTGINDNNLTTDVSLTGSTSTDDPIGTYEAAGVIWSAPQTISSVTYINGSFDANSNGVFTCCFGLQFTTDGTTWTASGWTYSPSYPYDSASAGSITYTFTGSATSLLGVRAAGQVHASDNSNSWHANAREVQAFVASAPPNTPTSAATSTTAPTFAPPSATFTLIPPTNTNVPPSATSPSGGTTTYQAENATLSQAVLESTHTGYTGTGYVNDNAVVSAYVEFNVNAAQAGAYQLVFRYANGSTGNRPANVSVNGTVISNQTFPVTGSWDTWATVTVNANLNAGSTLVRLTGAATDGPNLDKLDVTFISGVIPTTIAPTATNTVMAPTSTLSATNTSVPPTMTTAPTNTSVPPTMTTVPPTATQAPTGWPSSHYYVPYIDVSLRSDLNSIASASGSMFFSLAFIIDNGTGCQAVWGGTSNTMSSTFLVTEVNNLRNAGGNVVVSFGGAAGNELALDCGSVSSLQAQYQAVINKYSLDHLDFDVEGAAISNTSSVDRRNKAIKGLEAANPTLVVSYTLAVDTTGLPTEDINLLKNAVSNGTRVDVVNIMAMDYGRNLTNMGSAATQAATSTFNQLKTIFTGKTDAQIWHMIGITPMIGVNDTNPETFTLSNAQTVLTFSQQNNTHMIGMWSMNRDFQCPSGTAQPADTCSGVSQSNYGFSNIWKAFNQ